MLRIARAGIAGAIVLLAGWNLPAAAQAPQPIATLSATADASSWDVIHLAWKAPYGYWGGDQIQMARAADPDAIPVPVPGPIGWGICDSYEIGYSTVSPGKYLADWFTTTATLVVGPAPETAGTSQTWDLNGLSAGTLYYVAIRALNADGLESWSNVVPVTTVAGPVIVPTPTPTPSVTEDSGDHGGSDSKGGCGNSAATLPTLAAFLAILVALRRA